mmetsp:Transcript_12155/g.29024  ORF Transcript_12155/g.29024 Transcript_12155/m.29024 type:complete len:539 (+) Transcript_12155:34-1650(+)|eukprot:CAMPEP_0177695956 /NCGR_PEP_ID=MMETSP0484_2-20121128/3731_1 /TAXON_ID=354590 /ORGANISM="Rhodomonas lens, Strain RHODO" /LENGTH=538 /DNA_ID=CAMNT_0019206911 /DNA_START=8 /DNA_END=1624 /DNA_ORIENTATION=-
MARGNVRLKSCWMHVLVLAQLLFIQAVCDTAFDCLYPQLRAGITKGGGTECTCSANVTQDGMAVEPNRLEAQCISRLRGGAGSAFVAGAAPRVKKEGATTTNPVKSRQAVVTFQEQATKVPSFLRWLFKPAKKQKFMPNPSAGVMVQGFDWESMSDRPRLYSELEKELPALASAGINVVWFPPPSSSADPQGYLPGKWYEIPHKAALQRAIKKADSEGVVTMVDVVLNHRTASRLSATTNDWTSFENPDWEEWAIVKDDWKCEPFDKEKFCLDNCTCGAVDTGENACFAPDIDHSNPRIQADVIAWLEWLRADIGFDAFRFDNTKGYAASYTALYIEASKPLLSVGEYFDTNKDLLTSWVRGSRGNSRTFDFGMRYKLKDSVQQDDYSHLMDKFFGPMIWYDKEHSVTFLDNHDTAGDLNDRFGTAEQIAMGYAFLLTHPGLPCIFWQDWLGPNQEVIRKLVEARSEAGVTASSVWKVVTAGKGLYAAFVDDSLAVKVGSGDWSPNQGLAKRGWERSVSGPGWAVWLRIREEDEVGIA